MIQIAHSAFETAHFERANRRQAHIERLEMHIPAHREHLFWSNVNTDSGLT